MPWVTCQALYNVGGHQDVQQITSRGTSFIAGLIALLVSAVSLVAVQSPAQAVNATEFSAGNIISDANFYDGRAMSSTEVQNFLNEKVSRCTIGDPGYAAGSVRGTNTIASKCLRNFTLSTASKASNAYCGAYSGAANESAAQIIAKVGEACGISQKVLLVMLEKEQSLVSDTWPYVRQFDVAMGYACPDSGPNNSANCDSNYSGFYNQVYRAAWQLKVYRGNPSSYRYQPFATNTIQWHPNAGCGTSQVYIENWATAALYIYTPYRPNQAALNAGWGTGDNCSTYGNRNFFLFFNTWFGNSPSPGIAAIDAKRTQNAWLGVATSEHNYISANGGGYVRAYENGAVAWSSGRGAFVISGDFRAEFNTRGGLAGNLSWPTSDVNNSGQTGKVQGFAGGALTQRVDAGFVLISGEIRSFYTSQALGLSGPAGWPLSDAVCTAQGICTQVFEQGTITASNGKLVLSIAAIDQVASAEIDTLGTSLSQPNPFAVKGGGFVQGFTKGAVVWSKETGAYSVSGPMRTAYGTLGSIGGSLGWPISAQSCFASGACSQKFQTATLHVNADGRGSTMTESIATGFRDLLGLGTDLGESLGNTVTFSNGAVHPFSNGALASSERTGTFAVTNPVRAPFNAAGGLQGTLGWPTAQSESIASSTLQKFEGGAVVVTTKGNFILDSKYQKAFDALGGVSGTLGLPITNEVVQSSGGGGSVQAFEGGALTRQKNSESVYLLAGAIREEFARNGGLAGMPGWPAGNAQASTANGGGTVQAFQNAAITSSPYGTYAISGGLRSYFNSVGGLSGALGWPSSSMSCTIQECRQSFQGGTIIWSPTEGGLVVANG